MMGGNVLFRGNKDASIITAILNMKIKEGQKGGQMKEEM
jgi:hypothetical protein